MALTGRDEFLTAKAVQYCFRDILRWQLEHPVVSVAAITAYSYIIAQAYTSGYLSQFRASLSWFDLSLPRLYAFAWPGLAFAATIAAFFLLLDWLASKGSLAAWKWLILFAAWTLVIVAVAISLAFSMAAQQNSGLLIPVAGVGLISFAWVHAAMRSRRMYRNLEAVRDEHDFIRSVHEKYRRAIDAGLVVDVTKQELDTIKVAIDNYDNVRAPAFGQRRTPQEWLISILVSAWMLGYLSWAAGLMIGFAQERQNIKLDAAMLFDRFEERVHFTDGQIALVSRMDGPVRLYSLERFGANDSFNLKYPYENYWRMLPAEIADVQRENLKKYSEISEQMRAILKRAGGHIERRDIEAAQAEFDRLEKLRPVMDALLERSEIHSRKLDELFLSIEMLGRGERDNEAGGDSAKD